MSLGLTKPGASVALRHPKTGILIEPIGYLKNGTAVWPVLGASSDDEDDPAFTGAGGGGGTSRHEEDDEDEDQEDDDTEDDEDDKPPVKKKAKKDDDKDDEGSTRPERQAARYRVRAREAENRANELAARLKAIEDSDKPADELMTRDLAEARERAENLTEVNRILTSQLAFFKANTVSWVDPTDAFTLAEKQGLFDDVIDEDGNVDTRELDRALRALAKSKPHLVKKTPSRARDEEDDDEKDKSSASTMNGRRKGSQQRGTDRASLAKRFPVLGR